MRLPFRRIDRKEENSQPVGRAICILLAFLCLTDGNVLQPAHAQNLSRVGAQWKRTLSKADGPLEQLRLVVPFYEGVEISNPISSLRDVGLAQFELAYPGVLSAPFVAWTFGGNNWTAVYVERLDALPVAINVKATDVEVEIALKCYTASAYRVIKVDGDWTKLAQALRGAWDVKARRQPLAKQFTKLNFYVNRWASKEQTPHLRQEWTVEQLVDRMKCAGY